MRTSAKCPQGTPNDWPVEDYNAWKALMTTALVILDKQAETATCSDDINPIIALQTAADNIGLRGKKLHWLVDLCLANHHGLFECTYDEKRGRFYMRADSWLRLAPLADLSNTDKQKEAKRQAQNDLMPKQLTKHRK